ncbi:glycosyltransferase, partial [Aliarcobacter butzleri]
IKEELSKQSNISKQELDSIKEELSKQSNTSKQELKQINHNIGYLKMGVHNISNSHESLVAGLKNPLRIVLNKIKRRLQFMNKLNYETHKDNLIEISKPEKIYDKWLGNKKFIMICHDQVIDRRIIEQYKTLLKNGWDNGIIIGFSFDDEDHIVNENGVIIHRIGLKRIIPTEILYWQYQRREVLIYNLNIAKKLLGKINFFYYKLRVKYKFKGKNVQDPLPFDNVFYNTGKNYLADLIVAHDLPALNASVKLSKEFNCKIIYDSHEMYSKLNGFSKFQKFLLSEVEAYNIKQCDAVITVSDTIALEFEKKYKVKKPDVIFSSYNLMNEAYSNKSLYELANIDKNDKIMLFQGGISLDPNRNMKVLLKGFIEAKIDKLHFVLLGPIEQNAKNMILKYSAEQYNKTVHILDAVSQSELLYLTGTASFGVIPYKPLYAGDIAATGCLPNKFFEFMQANLPILANEHLLEVKNILNQYGGGITYNMNDIKNTAKAIKKMSESDLNQFKKDLNKNKFLFSWDNEEIKYLEIINRIKI